MPAFTRTVAGEPIWVDMVSTDPALSRDFWTRLLGWTATAAPEEYGGYVNFSLDGQLVAGLAGQPAPHSAWQVWLETPDAASTAEAVTAGGGEVHMLDVAGDLGTMLALSDPTGARLGGWQPGAHRGFAVNNEPSASAWYELHTTDFEAAVRFYESAFGWSTVVMADEPGLRIRTLGGPGAGAVAGIYDARERLEPGEPSQWVVYFAVTDADAAAARIEALGGHLLDPLHDTPFGRMTHAVDPAGARFAIIQRP